jgi:hypothetical protein
VAGGHEERDQAYANHAAGAREEDPHVYELRDGLITRMTVSV